MILSTLFVTLAAAVSAYASCSDLGEGATDTAPSNIFLFVRSDDGETFGPLSVANVATSAGIGYYVLTVSSSHFDFPVSSLIWDCWLERHYS